MNKADVQKFVSFMFHDAYKEFIELSDKLVNITCLDEYLSTAVVKDINGHREITNQYEKWYRRKHTLEGKLIAYTEFYSTLFKQQKDLKTSFEMLKRRYLKIERGKLSC